jgi:hypothetical protein
VKLKREAHPDFFASVSVGESDPERLRKTFEAEFRYLEAFEQALRRIPLAEIYPLLDNALAMAPWNDSLRARIYAQYHYFASIQSKPSRRASMLQRAEALYDKSHAHRAPLDGER